MNATDIFYTNTLLDRSQTARLVAEALGGLDDGELYLQQAVSESFSFDDNRLKAASFDAAQGFGLRGVIGETTAYAHSNDLSPAAIQRAGQTVAAVRAGYGGTVPLGFAAAPSRTNRQLYGTGNPLGDLDFDTKIRLLEDINSYARALDPRVAQVSVALSASWTVVEIVRPDGHVAHDVRPLVRLNVSIVVEQDGRRESGFDGLGGRHGYARLFDPATWRASAQEALRQALVNLDAVAAPAGEMTVVLGPGWPGILLHEAVGHGLEGDFNRKGASAFSGRVGEQVAARGVTVVDDGAMEERRGSLSIDDEGTPTGRTVLIEDGILKGYMQDRLNARLMGVSPTGNGRRESFAHAPMPRMTNTFLLGGDRDPAEIVRDVKSGIYARTFGGGQVDITSGRFVFTCTEAYKIENGRLGAPIKGATLIGSGPEAMQKVSAIGNDFALDPGIGICGKGGQSVPAGVGQATVRLEGLTVGGTATA